MNEEKTLTRIDSEYEKALAERDKLQAELDRLTKKETQDRHKLDTLKNRYKEEKRRSRNHRLRVFLRNLSVHTIKLLYRPPLKVVGVFYSIPKSPLNTIFTSIPLSSL